MWKTLLTTVTIAVLKNAAQFAWDVLWQIVTEAMLEAEKKWVESGNGEIKKEWVLEEAMEYIDKNVKLNFLTRWVVKTFVSKTIDTIVQKLNDQFVNHKWVDAINDLKSYVLKFFPGVIN